MVTWHPSGQYMGKALNPTDGVIVPETAVPVEAPEAPTRNTIVPPVVLFTWYPISDPETLEIVPVSVLLIGVPDC